MSGVSHTGSSGVHGAQQLFQLEQYDRCAALVEQLLLSEAQTGLLDKCTLLHLLAMSLLRTGHLTRAKEVLQRLGEALTQCEELTHDEREAWRACYLADKGEMLECEGHLLEAERAFTDASLIQAVVGYNYY
ncbi:hypothetical protein DQ04_04111040, partial [Trypanosoma grayi]|uniref:hypothetical protein n=1 Tax=Trypanosoma grayi TaxID=71804 RepID=UPI0004F46370